DPRGHLCEQQIMPHVIEVGLEVHVNDPRLVLDDRRRHQPDRRMRCLLWSIATRPRLKIRLKDWLQHELHRPLDPAVANGRDGGGEGSRYAKRSQRTAVRSNGRPVPVVNPAALSAATVSRSRHAPCRLTKSIAAAGVRRATGAGTGRGTITSSVAPERQRMPT